MDDPAKVSTIRGRVIGGKPGQLVVLYAKGETAWWVQPFANQPFTNVRPDSEWENSTHPGTEYAALLVGPDFHPPLTTNVLPTEDVFAYAITKGDLALWQRWWFPFVCLLCGGFAIFGLHRLRILQMSKRLNQRFEERLAERMRVAQELHDTMLQGLVSASMQLHVAVDQLPEETAVVPAFRRVLELMEQVIQEGRNTVRGLRSSVDRHDLKTSFSRIPLELGEQEGVNFRVIEEGVPLPLRPTIHNEIYRIGREALVNAFRHSRANNITVELEYAVKQLRIRVRDDGCGIDAHLLESGREGHWGLSGMRERSERIGAKLRVLSRSGSGTEVELRVPSEIAFESQRPNRTSKALRALYYGGAEPAESLFRKRAG